MLANPILPRYSVLNYYEKCMKYDVVRYALYHEIKLMKKMYIQISYAKLLFHMWSNRKGENLISCKLYYELKHIFKSLINNYMIIPIK